MDNLDGDYQTILGYGTPGTNSGTFNFQLNRPSPMTDPNPRTIYLQGYSYDMAGTTGLPLGDWHFVTVTYDGSTLKTYVDGVNDATGAYPGLNTILDPGGLRIGTTPNAIHHFSGLIDEVSLYNRALTQDEIAVKYSCIDDSNPDPYSLAAQTDINPGATASSTFVVTGINMPLSIRISTFPPNGFFGLNGGSCNLQDATVVSGDVVQVCLATPGFPPGQQVSTEVTVGLGINVPPATFSVTSKDFDVARESAGSHYYYSTLQDAYNNMVAASGDYIIARASLLPGPLDCNHISDQAVTIIGGYDALFDPAANVTTISPSLTIGRGTVTVENIEIR
jgi:hypothetical protein